MKAVIKSSVAIVVLLALCSAAWANENQPGYWDTSYLIAPGINASNQPYVTGWEAYNSGTSAGSYTCYVTFAYYGEDSYDSMGGAVNDSHTFPAGELGGISDDNLGGSGADIFDYDAPATWSSVGIAIYLQDTKGAVIDVYGCTMDSSGTLTSPWTEGAGYPMGT